MDERQNALLAVIKTSEAIVNRLEELDIPPRMGEAALMYTLILSLKARGLSATDSKGVIWELQNAMVEPLHGLLDATLQ